MIARGANQDRNRFILRTAANRNNRLLLNLGFSVAVDRARQRAETLLTSDPSQARNGALAQLHIFLSFSNANQIRRSAVAVVVARDTFERTAFKLARRH